MGTRICYRNFTGGEIAPTLSARYDLTRYQTSVQCMENFIPGLHGDVERRPGMRFVAEIGENAVLFPFSFSVDAGQNFILVLGDHTMRVASEEGWSQDGYVYTPWGYGDLYDLSIAQSGDVIYVAHRNYALRKIVRTGTFGHYAWSIRDVIINQSLAAPAAPTVTFLRGNANDTTELSYTLRYKIVAVDANGAQSLASTAGSCLGKHPSDWVSGNHVTLTWGAVAGAVEYNVYREEAGYYGFIGVSSAPTTSTVVTSLNGVNVGGIFFAKTERPLRARLKDVFNGYGGEAELIRRDLAVTDGTAQTVPDILYPLHNAFYSAAVRQLIVRGVDTNVWCIASGVSASLTGDYQAYEAYHNFGQNTDVPYGVSGNLAAIPQYAESSSTSYGFDDQNYEPDLSDTPKEDWNPFANGNNPGTVAFHQQRLVLGGTKEEPQTFYMSRTGDFENFRKSRPLKDDDPVEYALASGSIDSIQWIAGFGDLLVGTSGAEYKVAGNDGSAITPSGVSITSQSFWGSAGLSPIVVGNSILHCQRHGSRVRDLFYSLEKDGYAGNDLSVLAPHMFEGHELKQWAYQQTPGSNLWCVRDDGVLLCLTYLKEQDIWGWSRHTTYGEVVSVASVSGEDEDIVFCVVRRVISGTTHYFLERFAARFTQRTNIADAFFVDCGKTIELENAQTAVTGFSHLAGMEVSILADGAPVMGLTVGADGELTLPYAARKVTAGLPYASILSPLPVNVDRERGGSTIGKCRGYGTCILRVSRSVGGKYGSEQDGERYDIPFLPTKYGEACEPFSGDIEFNPATGHGTETSVWILQDRPLPMHIVAVACDVEFGGE